MALDIPEVVINRLPVYARALAALAEAGETVVSSQALGEQLDVTPAQIRKDLSYFGRFGKQGRGYNVDDLLRRLREILGLNQRWTVCVVGMGRLGQAIVEYGGFEPQGFDVVAVFDIDEQKVGKTVGRLRIQHVRELESCLKERPVDIGIVAVPASAAQEVVDRLIGCGVKSILNYAPTTAHVPRGVQVRQIDPVIAMQSMTYYLKDLRAAAK
ncbi:MAG: redox-sensing transcriptional repressor Rex [Dehalococcoidia bacterium]